MWALTVSLIQIRWLSYDDSTFWLRDVNDLLQNKSVDEIICLFELNLMVSPPLRCLVRFTIRYGRCPQVVLYILAVFCFEIGSSLDIGIRTNYLLKINSGGKTCSSLTRMEFIMTDLNTVVQFKNKFRTLVLMI
jgi:hypothetical protein